jgi:hypothetical protein
MGSSPPLRVSPKDSKLKPTIKDNLKLNDTLGSLDHQSMNHLLSDSPWNYQDVLAHPFHRLLVFK